jgi:hypothetical protein
MEKLYSPQEVTAIQGAYRAIFPNITPELASYWGLERERPWSCLTSDFHTTSYGQLHALHEEVRLIDRRSLDAFGKGAALRAASSQLGVGFSIGLCPWTDHLLGETYGDEKDTLTIIIGHDWYPIVVADRPVSGSPLGSEDSLRGMQGYWPAAPQAVFDAETVGLFFNLYPDYRPPADKKCGRLTGYGYSYEQCLSGVDAMMNAISKRFRLVQLISWGSPVWDALLPRVRRVAPGTLLSKHIQAAQGVPLTLELGGRLLSYLPLMHPGHWGNFGRPYHLRHLKHGFSAMDLGLPGPVGATNGKVYKARNAD